MTGKTSRLSKALAEMGIIVISVLMALAANSWYDGRSADRERNRHLERLTQDLEADSATYSFVLSVLDLKDTSLQRIAAVAILGQAPDSAFLSSLNTTVAMGFHTPGSQRATYDDLVATGNLRLIGDPALRAQLVRYYLKADRQWERIDRRRTTYPQAVYRLNPAKWDTPAFGEANPRLVHEALDSIRTPAFVNLLTAEAQLSDFERETVIDVQGQALELLAAVRAARGRYD